MTTLRDRVAPCQSPCLVPMAWFPEILDVAFNVDPGAQNVLLAVHTVLADNPANLGRSIPVPTT